MKVSFFLYTFMSVGLLKARKLEHYFSQKLTIYAVLDVQTFSLTVTDFLVIVDTLLV